MGALVQQAAAIAFKNTIKRLWKPVDDTAVLSDDDKNHVKDQVLSLMLSTPELVQRQLSETIAIIAQHDFPQDWLSLMPTMAEKIQQPDYHAIGGVLRTALPLFRR